MIIGDLWPKKINDLKREIRNIKTAHFKTATTINTMTDTAQVNFSLTYDSLTGQAYSTQRAIITLNILDGSEMVSACYLLGTTPSNLNDRFAFIKRLDSIENQIRYDITVYSQNTSDIETLAGGGSVNLNYNIQLVGSSRFSTAIEYKNILGGTS
ncbi:hypothetical protein [Fibrobacter sp.]|uniref:hypothetical protein n=1 Tax=Fibrobacter sp. TaxID=35828 RepID=UPI00388D0283